MNIYINEFSTFLIRLERVLDENYDLTRRVLQKDPNYAIDHCSQKSITFVQKVMNLIVL